MEYNLLADVEGKNGIRYVCSARDDQTNSEIIANAEKFYGVEMKKIYRIYPILTVRQAGKGGVR